MTDVEVSSPPLVRSITREERMVGKKKGSKNTAATIPWAVNSCSECLSWAKGGRGGVGGRSAAAGKVSRPAIHLPDMFIFIYTFCPATQV